MKQTTRQIGRLRLHFNKRLGRCCVELHDGTVLGDEFWPRFRSNLVIANEWRDSVAQTVPAQCNLTQHSPSPTSLLSVQLYIFALTVREKNAWFQALVNFRMATPRTKQGSTPARLGHRKTKWAVVSCVHAWGGFSHLFWRFDYRLLYLIVFSSALLFHNIKSFLDHVVKYGKRFCWLNKGMLEQ